MKAPSRHLATLIVALCTQLTFAQNAAEDTAVLIPPAVITEQSAQEPERLEVPPEDIITSRTIVRKDQTITIQKVQPQQLTPLPDSSEHIEPTPEQKTSLANKLALVGKRRMNMFSCTVHDGSRTHIRWTSQGKIPVQTFEAWSNINFHHLTAAGDFKKGDTTHSTYIGIGDQDSAKAKLRAARSGKSYTAPNIPSLPDNSATEPTFVITSGTPTPEDLACIEGLHEIYKINHAELITRWQANLAEHARSIAEQAANPPDSTPDIIIQHWTVPGAQCAEGNGGER